MLWVMIAHRYMTQGSVPMENSIEILQWSTKHYSAFVMGAGVSVDTFFVLSGLLISYTFLNHVMKSNKFNIVVFYIHRYLRLTPPFAAMILFEATLMTHIASGPYWKQGMSFITKPCIDNWWAGLLYIQNYYKPMEICVGQSWYLAVDMQLFIISPILLIPLWKWRKIALGFMYVLLLAFVGIVFGIVYVNEFPGGLMDINNQESTVMADVYVPTHTRFGPWLAGMILGSILHQYRNSNLRLNKFLVGCMWVLVLASMLAIVLGAYPFFQFLEAPSLLEGTFYQAFSRLSWAICICWIIFACSKGYGGSISWFLSHKYWQPLSRLSYCMYLTHMMVQRTFTMSTKQSVYFSDVTNLYIFLGDLAVTILVSIVWSLAFESPVTVIDKIIFAKKVPDKSVSLPRLAVKIQKNDS